MPRGPDPLSRDDRIRRAIVACGLCVAAALPSFVIAALAEYDVPAMIIGVILFAGLMVVISWTPEFRLFTRKPFVRRSLFLAYGIRMIVSAGAPVLFVADALPGGLLVTFLNTLAVEMGVIDVVNFGPPELSGGEIPPQPLWFFITLALVLAQGLVLNLLLGLVFVLAWLPQSLILGNRDHHSDRPCARCRHSLEGLSEDAACPECGWNHPHPPPSWIERARLRSVLFLMLATCILIGVAAASLQMLVD